MVGKCFYKRLLLSCFSKRSKLVNLIEDDCECDVNDAFIRVLDFEVHLITNSLLLVVTFNQLECLDQKRVQLDNIFNWHVNAVSGPDFAVVELSLHVLAFRVHLILLLTKSEERC